jgi:hypothetical protein
MTSLYEGLSQGLKEKVLEKLNWGHPLKGSSREKTPLPFKKFSF